MYMAIIATLLVLSSCNFPTANFEPGKEYIKLKDFAVNPVDYKCNGSYKLQESGVEIATDFNLPNKLELAIIFLGKQSKNIKFSSTADSETELAFHSFGMYHTFLEVSYFYNQPVDKIVSDINLLSDGKIRSGVANDSIHEYHISFTEFDIKLNDRIDFGIRGQVVSAGSAKMRDAEIIFYKKNNAIYLLLLISKNRNVKIQSGTLVKYLNNPEYK
jgi:hypothetical protein